jgi:neutral ceramidase
MTFGAHATLFDETQLTPQGDWPGRLMGLTGGLVFPGAIGNASPAPPEGEASMKASTMARNLFDEEPVHSFPVDKMRWESEAISLPVPSPHPEFAAANKVNDALAQLVVSRFAPPSARLSVVQLGKTLLIGVPGEPSTPVARMLESTARQRGFEAIVVSHANGWLGYILDPEDYRRGGYEATLMFHGPDLSLRLNEALARLIARL